MNADVRDHPPNTANRIGNTGPLKTDNTNENNNNGIITPKSESANLNNISDTKGPGKARNESDNKQGTDKEGMPEEKKE